MSTSTPETKQETGRTPSMAASLLVLAVMIGLILLSVVLFGEEVAEGPLQVSMTLATIFALGVSYYYGFRGALFSEAVHKSVNSALGTIFILLAIGAIIGVLYLAGTVPAFVYYGVALLSPRWYYTTVFILASFLSILTGSSFTTMGAVGVAFVGLTSLAELALILLIVTSIFRKRLRIKYEIWQVMHGLFAVFIMVASLVHVFVLGRFTAAPIMKTMWLKYGIVMVSLIIWYRILKPITHWKKRWEVVENKAERGDAHTLVLKPVEHDGFAFEPGQYAWIKKGKTPFALGQHPISFSSDGDVQHGGNISFTIKNLGDWSGKVVPNIQPGEQMWVDGPHGALSSDREQGMGYVLIAGGVGITPLYSMCQTIADREDVRPVFLFYGARDYENLTFREEFEALKDRKSLQVIYVLSEPGDGWQGEKGFINAELLKRYLPKQYKRFVYFICGLDPLMDSMEDALPKLGIPREKVLSERFGMV